MRVLQYIGLAGSAVAIRGEHPIVAVIQKLKDLSVKSRDEGQTADLAHGDFVHTKQNEIDGFAATMEEQTDEIATQEDAVAGYTAEIEGLEADIKELSDEIDEREAANSTADEDRKEEAAAFKKRDDNYKTTIAAIEGALKGLKGSNNASGNVVLAALKQKVKVAVMYGSAVMTHEDHQVAHAFLQQGDAPDEPKLRKYDFKSGGVIELLEKLIKNFEDEKLESHKAEQNAINAHALAKQSQDAAIKAATSNKEDKEKQLTDANKNLSDANDALTKAKASLEKATKDHATAVGVMKASVQAYETNTKLREEEQVAITRAIEILTDVSGLRNPETQEISSNKGGKTASEISFVQLAAAPSKVDSAIERAAQMLSSIKSKDAMLLKISTQVRGMITDKRNTKGAFKAIKNEIQKLIFRLNKEQQDEDQHKNWCDTEVQKTWISKEDKDATIATIKGKIAELEKQIANTKKRIAENQKLVADLSNKMKDETRMRDEDREQNNKTIADAEEGKGAVQRAIGVLTEFYAKAGENTDVDTANAKAFTGSGGNSKGGVISILEKVLEDYNKMFTAATSQEEADQEAYDQFMSDSKVSLADYNSKIKMDEERKTQKSTELSSRQKALKKAENSRDALLIYLKDLEPSCGGVTTAGDDIRAGTDKEYETRKAARTSEIEGLKGALKKLAEAFGATSAFVQENSFLARH